MNSLNLPDDDLYCVANVSYRDSSYSGGGGGGRGGGGSSRSSESFTSRTRIKVEGTEGEDDKEMLEELLRDDVRTLQYFKPFQFLYIVPVTFCFSKTSYFFFFALNLYNIDFISVL